MEWIAFASLTDADCNDPPVDVFEAAHQHGLDVRWRLGPAHMIGRVIYVDPRGRTTRRHAGVAHELAHVLLQRNERRDNERAARCLLVPRTSVLADLAAGTCPWELRARHRNATRSMVVRRIGQTAAWLGASYGRMRESS